MEPPKPPRRTTLQVLLVFGLGVAGIAALGAVNLAVRHARDPRARFASVEEFEQTLNSSGNHRWMTFTRLGRTYYEAKRLMPLWLVPSGSTCYVFNEDGRYEDWILDNGESNRWDTKWGQTGRTETTINQIRKDLAARKSK
jgi:hypothetical protein